MTCPVTSGFGAWGVKYPANLLPFEEDVPTTGASSGTDMEFPEAERIAQLTLELHQQPSVEGTLQMLVESAPAVVGIAAAGTVLTRGGRKWDAGPCTGDLAAKADQLHVEVGEGPGFSALEAHHTVVANRLSSDGRWPNWGPSARELGVESVLAIGLWTSAARLGAMLFYGTSPDGFDDAAVVVAELLGRHASLAVGAARHEESLARAIDTRKLVGQAQGILMERYALDDRRAFDVLRRYSQTTNTKLNEVARILVTTGRLPDDV